jgi:hypothetical protein
MTMQWLCLLILQKDYELKLLTISRKIKIQSILIWFTCMWQAKTIGEIYQEQ